jgi:hypothetical protein
MQKITVPFRNTINRSVLMSVCCISRRLFLLRPSPKEMTTYFGFMTIEYKKRKVHFVIHNSFILYLNTLEVSSCCHKKNNTFYTQQTILHIIRKRTCNRVNVSEQLDAYFFRILTVQVEWNYLTSRVVKMEASDSWEMSVTVHESTVRPTSGNLNGYQHNC